nr:hypothetical protein [Kibdelosporangium sp. MJ126-NF4]CEL14961.1 hypothetical protein [Kibdelosporangium sp. MJ126-NF4]CTQ93446.1 hypothetical protein [Kibdelosporangium sp. MJ126-NF4]
MSDVDLPPFGRIPDDVRDRVRSTVQQRIRRPRRSLPIAIAAAVAVLATTTVVITTRSDTPATPATVEAVGEVGGWLNRCWAAVEQAGKTAAYPPRSAWQWDRAYKPGDFPIVVIVDKSDATTFFFCEITETTVVMSKPTTDLPYAKGTRAARLLQTDSGTVAGVFDPTWPATEISTAPNARTKRSPDSGPSIFMLHERWIDSTSKVTVRRSKPDVERTGSRATPDADPTNQGPWPEIELPPAPAPEVKVVDRPEPPEKRDSDIRRCQSNPNGDKGPPDAPGPSTVTWQDGVLLAMIRDDSGTGACRHETAPGGADVGTYLPGPPIAELRPDEPLGFATGAFGSKMSIGGTVPMRTARMELRFANDTATGAVVSEGTFWAAIPNDVPLDPRRRDRAAGPVTARLFDAAGAPIFAGTLRQWDPPK